MRVQRSPGGWPPKSGFRSNLTFLRPRLEGRSPNARLQTTPERNLGSPGTMTGEWRNAPHPAMRGPLQLPVCTHAGACPTARSMRVSSLVRSAYASFRGSPGARIIRTRNTFLFFSCRAHSCPSPTHTAHSHSPSTSFMPHTALCPARMTIPNPGPESEASGMPFLTPISVRIRAYHASSPACPAKSGPGDGQGWPLGDPDRRMKSYDGPYSPWGNV